MQFNPITNATKILNVQTWRARNVNFDIRAILSNKSYLQTTTVDKIKRRNRYIYIKQLIWAWAGNSPTFHRLI